MLQLLDVLLTIIHILIIVFNLFGWIPKRTRKAHLVSILLTAASWFVLGIWYGTGYCPFTEWQWKVKLSWEKKACLQILLNITWRKLQAVTFNQAL